MKKTICIAFGLLAFSMTASAQDVKKSYDEILYADPTVYVENDNHYLLGTRNREPLGFTILE